MIQIVEPGEINQGHGGRTRWSDSKIGKLLLMLRNVSHEIATPRSIDTETTVETNS